MNKPLLRFDKKLSIIYFTIIFIVGVFISLYLSNINLLVFLFMISIFVLLIIQLYKDTIIPKIPKITFLLYVIILILLITILFILSSGILWYFSFFIPFVMAYIYNWIEDYYNEDIDNSIRFKYFRKNVLLVIVMGGLISLYFLIFILLTLLPSSFN